MAFNIDILNSIQTKKVNEILYFELNSLVKFFKANHLPTDKIKIVKQQNIERVIAGYDGAVYIFDNEKYITLLSGLKYFLMQTDNFSICKTIGNSLVDLVAPSNNAVQQTERLEEKPKIYSEISEVITMLDLYKIIAKHGIKQRFLQEIVPQNANKVISTLLEDYKDQFNENEWNIIRLFEYNFMRYANCDTNSCYEDCLKDKQSYYKFVVECSNVGKKLASLTPLVISERRKRQMLSNKQECVSIYNNRHIPSILEDEISTLLSAEDDITSVNNVICVDCHVSCQHPYGLHVFIEIEKVAETQDNFMLLSADIRKLLAKQHSITVCPSIMFLDVGSLTPYNINGAMQRFHLQDDIYLGKWKSVVLHQSQLSAGSSSDSTGDVGQCVTCYNIQNVQPLDWRTLDTLVEWHWDVPLVLQLIFDGFINKKVAAKSDKQYLSRKFTSLYETFDRLLNLFNKHYIGIRQQHHTDELAIKYQSVNTVFSITSAAGATMALRSSEKKMKLKSDPDMCYFNTFHRKFALTYTGKDGFNTYSKNLQECIITLMMDNLVRLGFHRDPNPSESRSFQVCTLPITLKGVPVDAEVVSHWHDEKLCNGAEKCKCVQNSTLAKQEAMNKLLLLSDDEVALKDRYRKYSAWSFLQIWDKLKDNQELIPWLSDAVTSSIMCDDRHFGKQNIGNVPSEESPKHSLINCSQTSNIKQHGSLNETHLESIFIGDDKGSAEGLIFTDYLLEKGADDLEIPMQSIDIDAVDDDKDEMDYEKDNDDAAGTDDSFISGIHSLDEGGDHNCLDIDQSDYVEPEEVLNEIINEVDLDFIENELDISDQMHAIDLDLSTTTDIKELLLSSLKFKIYEPPKMITRHPPPEAGKDDDLVKLKEILDNILIRLGYIEGMSFKHRILIGVDNKIGKNVLKLMKSDAKYKIFLPEFPLLHLRKSKIVNLFNAYKNAGLVHILRYMKDDVQSEWTQLLTLENIDTATKFVWRIGMALRIAIFCAFLKQLSHCDRGKLFEILHSIDQDTIDQVLDIWDEQLAQFILRESQKNATFLLHKEMLDHCDEITSIALSERLGGKEGYSLLLSSVKSSLTFSYLNGASSYAAYCTDLLQEHYTSGVFYQNMKMSLYTSRHKESPHNFALDTQREMDHRDVINSFRKGACINSVIPKMSLVDLFNEANDKPQVGTSHSDYDIGWKINPTDLQYILRATGLILRQNPFTSEPCTIPYNIYAKDKLMLSPALLDQQTNEIGEFLIRKYVCSQGLFGFTKNDMPKVDSINGPKDLLDRVKKSKGVTVNRSRMKNVAANQTERERKEVMRQKKVATVKKRVDCLSSEMNACQALVKPDCSKPKVMKATGIQNALLSLLVNLLDPEQTESALIKNKPPNPREIERLTQENLFWQGVKRMPEEISKSVTKATLEFAGYKFKTNVVSGSQYIKYVESILNYDMLQHMPLLKHIIVCEEKYQFTPNDFKAATREQRRSKKESISHLKKSSEILNFEKFDKVSLVTTEEGKSLISTYLASHISELQLKKNLRLDIDSEHVLKGCICNQAGICTCDMYTNPITCTFHDDGYKGSEILEGIKQCKGEAEMAQVDWLFNVYEDLKCGEGVANVVSSGDIDSVVIHLFALSKKWPRACDGTFKNPVYIILQKPGK